MKNVFLKNSSVFLLTSLVTNGLGFITLPIYTRYLNPSDFGLLTLFFLFGPVTVNLLSIGLMSSSYRFYFEYKLDFQRFKIFNTTNILFNLIFFLFFGISLIYSSRWISVNIFDNKISSHLLRLSYIAGCFNYFIQYFLHLLSAQLKTYQFAFISITKIIIDIFFSFYFIFFFSLTYIARINATLISQSIVLILSFMIVKNLFTNKFSFKCLKESLLFSYPNTPSTVVGLAYQSFDKLMITNYWHFESLGHYSIGERISGIFKLLTDSITRVFTPFFQENAHNNTNDSKDKIINLFYKLSGFYLLGAFTLICFSEELIKILTTPKFYPSIYLAPIFVFYYLFGAIMGMLSINQIMFGKKLIYQIPASFLSIIINVTLNIFLIPKYGAIGAVFATAISALFSDLLLLYYGQRVFFLPINIKKLIFIFLLIIFFTFPVYFLMLSDLHYIQKIFYKTLLLFIFIFLLFKMSIFNFFNVSVVTRKCFDFIKK